MSWTQKIDSGRRLWRRFLVCGCFAGAGAACLGQTAVSLAGSALPAVVASAPLAAAPDGLGPVIPGLTPDGPASSIHGPAAQPSIVGPMTAPVLAPRGRMFEPEDETGSSWTPAWLLNPSSVDEPERLRNVPLRHESPRPDDVDVSERPLFLPDCESLQDEADAAAMGEPEMPSDAPGVAEVSPLDMESDDPPIDVAPLEPELLPETDVDPTPDVGPAESGSAEQGPPAPRPLQLTPAMQTFRDRVRGVIAANQQRGFSTVDNTPSQVISYCFAYGVAAEVAFPEPGAGPRGPVHAVNAIGALCWNFPFAGNTLLRVSADGVHIVPKVGRDYQEAPGQLLAMLAMARVPADYEVRCERSRATIADLVEFEKRTCYEGDDLAWKLIGLSFYVDPTETWQNGLGETWSLEKLVREELESPAPVTDRRLTTQLLALTSALQRWRQAGLPIEGDWTRARRYVEDYIDFTLAHQNDDGGWNERFFAGQGKNTDLDASLMANGQILRWLIAALPDERLNDPRVVRGINYVTSLLSQKLSTRQATAGMAPEVLEAVMGAAHSLVLYDQRYFSRFEASDAETAAGSARAVR